MLASLPFSSASVNRQSYSGVRRRVTILRLSLIATTILVFSLIGLIGYAKHQNLSSTSLNLNQAARTGHLLNGALLGDRESKHILASWWLMNSNDPSLQKQGFNYLQEEYAQGSAYAAGKLGWAYQLGLGVEMDRTRAIELYEHAAKRGMTYWQYLLAHAYEKGYLGFVRSEERMSYWLNYEHKVHIDGYECWIAYFYQVGIYPRDTEAQKYNESICESGNAQLFAFDA